MKKFVLSITLGFALITGCTTTQEARKNLVFKSEGDNSVTGVADCITRQFKGTSDIFLSREIVPKGLILKVVMRGQFGMHVLHVVDIYDIGGKTVLEASSPRKASRDPAAYDGYVACLRADAATTPPAAPL